MWAITGELWLQIHTVISFRCVIVHTFTHNLKTTGHTQLLYYQRHSFFGLDLHERSNWKAMVPDMNHVPFLIQYCVCTTSTSRKIQGTCNSTKLHLTPILPRMILFVLNCPSSNNQKARFLYIHRCIVIWCATMYDNKAHVPYDYNYWHIKLWFYCQQYIIL